MAVAFGIGTNSSVSAALSGATRHLVRAEPPATATASARWTLVGLGDSVPAGTNCDCATFVDLYGARLTTLSGVPVTVHNLGTPSLTSGDLLDSLAAGQQSATLVAEADVVTVTVGANDFTPPDPARPSCGGDDGLVCHEAGLAQLRTNLTSIVDRITELRGARPTAIRLTGYWNVFPDGSVGAQAGAAYEQVTDALTSRVNAVVDEVARAEHITAVDLYTPFKGADGNRDDTALLADDGDHPNAEGHRLIAATLTRTGYAPLTGRR
jgi:lysophospholipase L1-like esterase